MVHPDPSPPCASLETCQMIEPAGPSFSAHLRGLNPIRMAIVAGVGIVLALSAAITMAASPSAPGSAAGPVTPAASLAPNQRKPWSVNEFRPGFAGPFAGGGFRFGGGPGGGPGGDFGRGFGRMGAFGGVAIASIDGKSLGLKTADGWTRTITVTASTKITRGSQAITLSDIRVGDSIGFGESKANDGSYTIESIMIILPRIVGTVSAVTANTITVKQFNGTSATIHLGSSTTFRIFGIDKATAASIKVGMAISAEGNKKSDGSLDAVEVAGGQLRGAFPGGGHKLPGGPSGPAASNLPGA